MSLRNRDMRSCDIDIEVRNSDLDNLEVRSSDFDYNTDVRD